MKILIVISDLCSGGAQKSLLSFLQVLERENTEFEIDLLVCSKQGMFLEQIPPFCKILNVPDDIACMNNPPTSKLFLKSLCFRGLMGKIYRYLTLPFMRIRYKDLNNHQVLWLQWKKFIHDIKGDYDVAISYLEGYTNYLVIDKVKANRKLLWVHSEYEKLTYNPEFDYNYFSNADSIVTISDICVQSLINKFPEFSVKIPKVENISSPILIRKMADEFYPNEYNSKSLNLLSIGRLNFVKGFDLAIESAKLLQEAGVEFKWYIIGDGAEKSELINQIHQNRLEEKVVLLGLRENPYPYIKHCDLFIQTSRYEGKSIVLDEAKILCKPIVVTNYTTVKDQITDGINGIVVDMVPEKISKGIIMLSQSPDIQKALTDNLSQRTLGNEDEIIKYINLFMGEIYETSK